MSVQENRLENIADAIRFVDGSAAPISALDFPPRIRGLRNVKVSNIINTPWYNPGTGLGGISWTDPDDDFDHIEIVEIIDDVPVVAASIAKGVQHWEPETGTHSYIIRVVFEDESVSNGVQLEETTYTTLYTANPVSVIIPVTVPNQIILSFDNFISVTDAAGFSISGISDTLTFIDRPNNKSIRLQLTNKIFVKNISYSLGYDSGAGNVEQADGNPIANITSFTIQNNSNYLPAALVGAEIPQAEPDKLVLVMSRAVSITDYTAYTLTGTSAAVTGVVSTGETVELSLSEPVDHSDIESDIKLSYSGSGTTDDMGQTAAAFSNAAVTNNSTNQAITIQSAEVPSTNSKHLIVVMQGAVTMEDTAGFSLASEDQNDLPELATADYTISDGTITFEFDADLYSEKTFTLSYDGTGSLKAASNGDTVRAFTQTVTNNSSNTGGFEPGTSARNLGVVLLGHDPTSKEEVELVMDEIHNTIVAGNKTNFFVSASGSDYFIIPTITVASATYKDANNANTSYTGGTYYATELTGHGNLLAIEIVDTTGYIGKNGNTQDHIVMYWRNMPMGKTYNKINNSNITIGGYAASAGKKFVEGAFRNGMITAGIKEAYLLPVNRKISTSTTEAALFSSDVFLPTEWELFGVNTRAPQVENDGTQIHFTRYLTGNGIDKIKYVSNNEVWNYWESSVSTSYAPNGFCSVGHIIGDAAYDYASYVYGIIPCFCVA
ncbi:hypothetical protein AGMMS50212_13520 [Spirochaetia bacterium]|nr:hypothetical protein AGMMS50212_13520 [Spirochaetia bacterium]